MTDLQRLMDHYTRPERRKVERRRQQAERNEKWLAEEADRRWHERRLSERYQ